MTLPGPNDWADWFRGKEFSQDWTSPHFPVWSEVLAPLRERPCELLEIGSWEGRSAVFFLEFLPLSRITCIDTFGGSPEHFANAEWRASVPKIERRFDANLAGYHGRFEKIRARSATGLDSLLVSHRTFDVIYVDGSHRRDDVLIDTLSSWQMLKPGGTMIWDDYGGGKNLPDVERAKPAVDMFLEMYAGDFTLVRKHYQMIVRKTPGDRKPTWLRRQVHRLGRRLGRF